MKGLRLPTAGDRATFGPVALAPVRRGYLHELRLITEEAAR